MTEYEKALALVQEHRAKREPELLTQRNTLVEQIKVIDDELTTLGVAIPSSFANGGNTAKPTTPVADRGYTDAQKANVEKGLDGKTLTSGQFAELLNLTGSNDAAKAKRVREAMERDGIIEAKARANGFNMMYVWRKGQPMGVPVLPEKK